MRKNSVDEITNLDQVDWDNSNYLLKYIKDDVNHLEIHFGCFTKYIKPDLILDFQEIVDSYVISKRRYHPLLSGLNNRKEYTFFLEVKESEYIRWLMEESSPYGLDFAGSRFKHYVFSCGSLVIDIISSGKPNIKFVYNKS